MIANFKTLVELWEQSTERHGPRELFGTRPWGLALDHLRAVQTGSGRPTRRTRHARDRPGRSRGLIAGTGVEWAAAAYATFGLGATFVPMYEAQPLDDWAFILKDCEAKLVLASSAEVVGKITSIRDRAAPPGAHHRPGFTGERPAFVQAAAHDRQSAAAHGTAPRPPIRMRASFIPRARPARRRGSCSRTGTSLAT